MQRLATSHSEPVGDVYTRYDRGYCLYVRPVDSIKYGGSQAMAAYSRCGAAGRGVSLGDVLPPARKAEERVLRASTLPVVCCLPIYPL